MTMAQQKQTNKSLATLDDTNESNPAVFVKEGIYIHLLSISLCDSYNSAELTQDNFWPKPEDPDSFNFLLEY